MIVNPLFKPFVSGAVAETLQSVSNEFDAAAQQNTVTESLGRKYHSALAAYENALGDCPWSPDSMTIEPTAHDGIMRDKMREELGRVRHEYSRILNHFGGALSLAGDDD